MIEQGSLSWHKWRSQGLGASDAPAIMGVSPWSTPYQLWEIKTGRIKKDFSNWATERGNRLEPKARATYEFLQGFESPAMLSSNQTWPFIRASLDGYNEKHGIILEIKCPGKEDHEKALKGQIPEKYFPQLQHQLLACPAAKKVHYFSFDGEKGVCIEVLPDKEYAMKLFDALCSFWKCIQEDTPPLLGEKDFKIIDDPKLIELAAEYRKAYEAAARINKLRKELFEHELIVDRRVQINDMKINLCYRQGVPFRSITWI